MGLNRYGEALAAYDKSLALNPDLIEAWLGRGTALNRIKRFEEAFTDYNKALALLKFGKVRFVAPTDLGLL